MNSLQTLSGTATRCKHYANLVNSTGVRLLDTLAETVKLNKALSGNPPKLAASGGITEQTLPAIAETGVDLISIGTLTKDCQSVDLSMRLIED